MGQASKELEEKQEGIRFFREAAQKARDCDEALDRMNREQQPRDILTGFDLDFLAQKFDYHADDLEGKPRD